MNIFYRLWAMIKERLTGLTRSVMIALPGKKRARLPAGKTAEAIDKAQPPAAPGIVRQYEEHPSTAYMKLKLRFRDIGRLSAIAETMGRDFLTTMPEGAWRSRLGQIAYLHRRMHEDLVAADSERLLEQAETHRTNNPHDWDSWDNANLREMQVMFKNFRHISPDLTERKARLSYEGRRVHRDCLAAGDWPRAREFLSSTIDLQKQIAEAKCRASGQNSLYQALMDEYMPGIAVSDIDDWFAALDKKLPDLLTKVMARQEKQGPCLPIKDFYPAKAQMWLNRALLEAIGFDFRRGGLYETGHNPVEGGTPDDTRLVIKNVDTTNFLDSMKSALHEGGHGLYIQGLPRKTWRYQPVALDMGAAVHESQALLIEMIIGRTRVFFDFLSPRVEGLFHGLHNPMLSAENLHKIKTRVAPGPLRRKADELTYYFHIKHRFQMEKDLIDGDLKLADLPDAWNSAMQEILGIIPDNHAEGCMQDVHWFVGKFGYFSAYAVGNMLAAQLYDTMGREVEDMSGLIGRGDFRPVTAWLGQNIHSRGRLMDFSALVESATGQSLSPQYLARHLESRYLRA